jgi:hypothetical protein
LLRDAQALGMIRFDFIFPPVRSQLNDRRPWPPSYPEWPEQRYHTHFMSNLLTKVPKNAQNLVVFLVRSIFAQFDAKEVWAQHGRGRGAAGEAVQ